MILCQACIPPAIHKHEKSLASVSRFVQLDTNYCIKNALFFSLLYPKNTEYGGVFSLKTILEIVKCRFARPFLEFSFWDVQIKYVKLLKTAIMVCGMHFQLFL